MADATLTDVVKKLEEVKFAVTTGDKVTAGSAAKAEEAGAEGAREDKELKSIFEAIRDKLGMKGGGDDGKGGFKLGDLFSGMGRKKLIASLAGGLVPGLSKAFAESGSLGKALATTLGPQLLKLLPAAALVAGLALAVKDGFEGYAKSKEWGVSKTSGVMGAVLGGTESGMKNAFANAGKWALIGAGYGMIGGIPGIIIGGLVGAAIGGILGFIGGKKLASTFDAIGTWFKDSFLAIWDVVMPDWVKQIDFQWTDIFPTMLVKLFKGEYFTVDVPDFQWYSLFPNFLVEWFKGTAEKISTTPFSWTDIFPKFLVDFFGGEMAKKSYVFSWTDLFPTWLVKIFSATKEAFEETPFTWYSLFPDWLVQLFKGVEITGGTKAWEWTDLFPGWLTKVITAGADKATEGGGFSWQALLPDWMGAAWGSTKALAGKAKDQYFEWKSLLPDWMQGYLTTAEGGVSKALGEVGSWNWKSLFPKFLQDIFDDPTQLAKEDYTWSWESLLPEFIVNLIKGKPIFGGEGAAGEVGGTGVDLSKINLVDTILKSVMQLVPESFLGVDIRKRVAESFGLEGFKEGGFASFTGPAMVHGTMQKPEFVLDNQATAVFLKAAQLLTGSQMLEQSRSGGGGQPVIINNNNVDNSVKSNSRQNISAPESVRQNESTIRALQAA